MHGAARPCPPEIREDPHGVESGCDLAFDHPLLHEPLVHLPDDPDLLVRPRPQHHAVGLKALVLAALEFSLHLSRLVEKHPAQPKTCHPALPEAQLDQPALPGKDLGRKLPAVFPRHGALDALDDGRDGRAVVLELLGDIDDLDARLLAGKLVGRTLVRVLEAAPAADVIDEDQLEVGVFRLHIRQQGLQPFAPADVEPALALVRVGPDDLDVVVLGVVADPVRLVLGRVLLVLGRHAHIFGGAPAPLMATSKLKARLHPAIQLRPNSGHHS